MHVELVHDGFHNISVPTLLGEPRFDQMQGTWAEQLIEICGRTCYDSMGTGRPSGEYHRNLILEQVHYSVAEHVHFTVDVSNWPPELFLMLFGLKDAYLVDNKRLTLNLRHCLEWPTNQTNQVFGLKSLGEMLRKMIVEHLPCLGSNNETGKIQYLKPNNPHEWFVTLFLEDSFVWSLEQNRHRGNISQRSGRFCDQTDRAMCMHPWLKDYLNDVPDVTHLASRIDEHVEKSRQLYSDVVEKMQPWLQHTKNLDARSARKQARSAARYYLGQGLSTEACYTYNLAMWKHVFKMRISPHADAAINDLMMKAKNLIRSLRPEYAEYLGQY